MRLQRSAGDGRYMGVGNLCLGSFTPEHRNWTISKDPPPVRSGRTARTSRAGAPAPAIASGTAQAHDEQRVSLFLRRAIFQRKNRDLFP